MLSPFNPSRPSMPSSSGRSDEMVLTLLSGSQSIQVNHDGFKIGTGRQCDLILEDPTIPRLHSQIHIQSGAVWIETVCDDLYLTVNGATCRRMALRDGDRLQIGSTRLSIQLAPQPLVAEVGEATNEGLPEDLASLTAEELCDRILTEQAIVKELSADADSGWGALVKAIEAVREVPTSLESENIPHAEEVRVYNALLSHLQELQVAIADRTRELNQKEAEVLATASMMEETQKRVTQRLDVILDHLNGPESNELRASA